MATPPTFIASNEGTDGWLDTASPSDTATFDSAVGDVWVTAGINANDDAQTWTLSNTGTAQTFTARGSVNTGNYPEIFSYTTVVANTLTGQSISAAKLGSIVRNVVVLRFSGSDGIGAVPAGEAETDNTAPSLTITTTGNNSAIVVFMADWDAVDGAGRTWLTVNSITPTAGNGFETTYFRDSSQYTVYVGYYPDAGTAGAKTVGLSAPTTGKFSIVAVEVLGTTTAASSDIPQQQHWPTQVFGGPWPLIQGIPVPDPVAVAADDLNSPLLGAYGDSSTYWQVYNAFSNWRSRAYLMEGQRRRDSSPDQLGQPLLENELLGSGTTWEQYNRAATHVDRRQVPQQRQLESPPGLLDTAELENELLGGATTAQRDVWRRDPVPPQQRIPIESVPGLLEPSLLEVPPPLPLQVATEYDRKPWLRVPQVKQDQSTSVAGTPYDPTLAPPRRDLAAYVDRREVPQQRLYPATPDPVVDVGTGRLNAWWSDDLEPFFIAATMPRYTVPPAAVGASYDPTLAPPYRHLNDHADRREVPQQRLYPSVIDPVVDVGTGRLNAWWSDDLEPFYIAATMPRYPVPDQPAGTPFDPLLAADIPYQLVRFSPITHASRRVAPDQREYFSTIDDQVLVGTGALVAWWGVDDTASYLGQRKFGEIPAQPAGTPFDPTQAGYGWIAELAAATHVSRRLVPYQPLRLADQSSVSNVADPTQAGYGPRWMWYRAPAIPQQRELESDPRLLLTALLEDALLGGWDDLQRHRAWVPRPWFGLQMLRQADQSDQPAPPADPTRAGYGPRWMWYRAPVAPVQRDRESDPRLLTTAQLEDILLGGWDDILRHRTWYTDRREVPQQRSYYQEPPASANPLLIIGNDWIHRYIPATHRARWVLRQWWQQQTSQAQPPLLFEGSIFGVVRGGNAVGGIRRADNTVTGGFGSGSGLFGGTR